MVASFLDEWRVVTRKLSTMAPGLCSVPRLWRRQIVHDSGKPTVIYHAPLGEILRSYAEVYNYIVKDGGCKCAFNCPLDIREVFNFDPNVMGVHVNLDSQEVDACSVRAAAHALIELQSPLGRPAPAPCQSSGNPLVPTNPPAPKPPRPKRQRPSRSKAQKSPYDGLLVSQLLAQRQRQQRSVESSGSATLQFPKTSGESPKPHQHLGGIEVLLAAAEHQNNIAATSQNSSSPKLFDQQQYQSSNMTSVASSAITRQAPPVSQVVTSQPHLALPHQSLPQLIPQAAPPQALQLQMISPLQIISQPQPIFVKQAHCSPNGALLSPTGGATATIMTTGGTVSTPAPQVEYVFADPQMNALHRINSPTDTSNDEKSLNVLGYSVAQQGGSHQSLLIQQPTATAMVQPIISYSPIAGVLQPMNMISMATSTAQLAATNTFVTANSLSAQLQGSHNPLEIQPTVSISHSPQITIVHSPPLQRQHGATLVQCAPGSPTAVNVLRAPVCSSPSLQIVNLAPVRTSAPMPPVRIARSPLGPGQRPPGETKMVKTASPPVSQPQSNRSPILLGCGRRGSPIEKQRVTSQNEESLLASKRVKVAPKPSTMESNVQLRNLSSTLKPSIADETPIFRVGDVVFGYNRGCPSWPGKLVTSERAQEWEQSQKGVTTNSVPSRKANHILTENQLHVEWFGAHNITLVDRSKLKTLTQGLEGHFETINKCRRTRMFDNLLNVAIQEAMSELDH